MSLTNSEQAVAQSMEEQIDPFAPVQEPTSSNWDWGDFLDFTIEEPPFDFTIHEPPPHTTLPPSPSDPSVGEDSSNSDRVRKRDPRLVCENYLAGIVPCACPEMDAMLAEQEEQELEEEGARGKKKARTARVRAPAGTARCQVPGCEADISELKGYHKRHRVCLNCASATEVLIHEEIKRYCQQCGKFHVLPDFDEGKRSCRRKLERHNNRRRRKSAGSKDILEKEAQVDVLIEDNSCDVEAEKDKLCLSNEISEKDSLLESEDGKHVSTVCSAPNSQSVQGDSGVSFLATDETLIDRGKENLKFALSSSHSDNKSAYSSMCPTGRISFKLYDWNPAEFPRRLRHQIFQWLASMPVELEGYIRPGCTILTAFISMPRIMWVKLLGNPASYLHEFVVAPGMMLSGKGSVLVYINDTIFFILKDGTSVMKIKEEKRVPRIHYVNPICFEAGKPMELFTCGSNLLQPKFRFLVSFDGRYLKNEYFISSHGKSGRDPTCNFEHQLYKIYIPREEVNLCGPAFIEVENESGLSNYFPILIGDKEVCSEMKKIQKRFDASRCSDGSHFAGNSCKAFIMRRTMLSDFISDIAWLLKEPASDRFQNKLTTSQIERYINLLNFLICNESTTILERVLQSLKIWMGIVRGPTNYTSDIDSKIFQKKVNDASAVLCERLKNIGDSALQSCSMLIGDQLSISQPKDHLRPTALVSNQDIETTYNVSAIAGSASSDRSENAPLLKRDVTMNHSHIKELQRHSWSRVFSSTGIVLGSRPTMFVIGLAVVCFGVCTILLHPQKVGKFAISIRKCMFDNP